jgi:hypothetical protein
LAEKRAMLSFAIDDLNLRDADYTLKWIAGP